MKILIVGESRGKNEAEHDHGFVGAAGVQLGRSLSQVGLTPPIFTWCRTCKASMPYIAEYECKSCGGRIYPSPPEMISFWRTVAQKSDIHITNVFEHQPPNNDIEWFFSKDGNHDLAPLAKGKYLNLEWMPSLIRLWDTVRTKKPNLILTLGACATWAITGKTTKITAVRGNFSRASDALENRKVLPTFHPSYILRVWADRITFLKDLQKAKRECEFPEIRRTERWITIAPTFDEIAEWFSRPATYYSCDIETAYALFSRAELNSMKREDKAAGRRNRTALLSSLISMVGFARSPCDALVIELIIREGDQIHPFHASPAESAEAWKWIIKGLQSPQEKVFQNGNYDIQRFLEHGIVPNNCVHDTMLRQHASFPEMEKSLGYLASIKLHEIAWKTMYSDRDHIKADE